MHWVGQQKFFCKICKCRSCNFIDVKKSYVTASMGEIWMCILNFLFNKIAAKLFRQNSYEVRTVMLSSKVETVFFERYAGVRLI